MNKLLQFASDLGLSQFLPLGQTPIIPVRNVAGRALTMVIAVMTFLASLTLGGVILVRDAAKTWESQIAREVTIQIRPGEQVEMEQALESARQLAAAFEGVTSAEIVADEAIQSMLAPWLGSDVDLASLPVPRLVTVRIDQSSPPDMEALKNYLTGEIPTASLDDHQNWINQLASLATSTSLIGGTVFILVLLTTVMVIVFATRGAMSGAEHIIEVLHFVGAESGYIARQFRHHFLITGAMGAVIGGIFAILLFRMIAWLSGDASGTGAAEQAAAFFGNFSLGWLGYFGVFVVSVLVAMMAAVTSHYTVIAYLDDLHAQQTDS